jgi:hypothetical protein
MSVLKLQRFVMGERVKLRLPTLSCDDDCELLGQSTRHRSGFACSTRFVSTFETCRGPSEQNLQNLPRSSTLARSRFRQLLIQETCYPMSGSDKIKKVGIPTFSINHRVCAVSRVLVYAGVAACVPQRALVPARPCKRTAAICLRSLKCGPARSVARRSAMFAGPSADAGGR